MRDALAALDGRRLRFAGTFDKHGSRPVYKDFRAPTFTLLDVRLEDGTPVCDHLWLNLTAAIEALDPRPGDVLSFAARVAPYRTHAVYRRRNGTVRCVAAPPVPANCRRHPLPKGAHNHGCTHQGAAVDGRPPGLGGAQAPGRARPTPEALAWWHLDRIAAALDPRAARLCACDAALAALAPFTAACPGDARPLVAIQVGRRYALGEAGEAERLAAGRLAAYACDMASERAGAFSAADAAANAAAFCVYRPPHLALHWALDWALHAQLGGAWWRHPAQALAILARHAEALEAMARTAG